MIYYHKKSDRFVYEASLGEAAKSLGVPEEELVRRNSAMKSEDILKNPLRDPSALPSAQYGGDPVGGNR